MPTPRKKPAKPKAVPSVQPKTITPSPEENPNPHPTSAATKTISVFRAAPGGDAASATPNMTNAKYVAAVVADHATGQPILEKKLYAPSLITGRCRCEYCKAAPRAATKPNPGGQHGPSPLDGDEPHRGVSPEMIAALAAELAAAKMTDDNGLANAATVVSSAAVAKPSAIGNMLAAKLAAPSASAKTNGYREPPHLIVLALAGTGKTTTLVGGLEYMLGITPRDAKGEPMVPSPQQAAVWEALKASAPRDGQKYYSVCFVAFNRSIAAELKRRLPNDPRLSAKTMHSLGAAAVYRAFKGQLKSGDAAVNEDRVNDIISELCDMELRQLRKTMPGVLRATRELVGLCKMNLVGHGMPPYTEEEQPWWDAALQTLADRHDVEVNIPAWKEDPHPDSPAPPQVKDIVYPLVPRVLERCKDVAKDGCFDLDDMIYLPVVLNLSVWQNDVLLIDEAQDLSKAQQSLAKKAGKRIVLCGDKNQAIYGFAGADSDSLPRMIQELTATPRGCEVLPLTVTRRCGRAIVEEARAYVQEFEAHESNPDGKVSSANYPIRREKNDNGESVWRELPLEQTYVPLVQDGDMVLCRANAPLVRECLRFLKLGRRAKIQGRKIGDALVALVEKFDAGSLPQLIERLSDWLKTETDKEMAERNPSANKLQVIQDKHDCVRVFVDAAHSVPDVIARISALFSDQAQGEGTGVVFSSIHRSKGLESDRVFLIEGFGPPMEKLQPWERDQMVNLRYVAITRARESLTFVV